MIIGSTTSFCTCALLNRPIYSPISIILVRYFIAWLARRQRRKQRLRAILHCSKDLHGHFLLCTSFWNPDYLSSECSDNVLAWRDHPAYRFLCSGYSQSFTFKTPRVMLEMIQFAYARRYFNRSALHNLVFFRYNIFYILHWPPSLPYLLGWCWKGLGAGAYYIGSHTFCSCNDNSRVVLISSPQC